MACISTTTCLLTTPDTFQLPIDKKIVLGMDFVVIVTAFLLHVMGVCLLVRRRLKNINLQNIMLIHLSLISMINIGTNGTAVYWKFHGSRFSKTMIVIYYIAHLAYILNLCLLALDRFICVAFPLRYRRKMTKFIIFVALGILWMLSIVFGMLIRYGGIANAWFYNYASYVYNGFVIAFSMFIYMFIVYKVHTRSMKNHVHSNNSNSKKLFIIPFLIILTFFLFTFLPHVIAYNVKFKNKNTRDLMVLGLIGINVLNNISDPIIYIFLQPYSRKRLLGVIRKIQAFLCCNKQLSIMYGGSVSTHTIKSKENSNRSSDTKVDVIHLSSKKSKQTRNSS